MRVNWTAIGVAAVADWLLGAVWFTTFSKQWQAGLRMSPEELQTYMSHPNFWPYLISLVCSAVMGYVIARSCWPSLPATDCFAASRPAFWLVLRRQQR